MPASRFLTMLDRYLSLLNGSHTRVTLFAVDLPGRAPPEVEAVVGEALASLGGVGRLPDGRVGLVYCGPHGTTEREASALHAYVAERIVRRLLDRGWGECASAIYLATSECWTDALRDARGLIAALPPPKAATIRRAPGRGLDASASRHSVTL